MQAPPFRQPQLLSLSKGLITIVLFFASGICLADTLMLNDQLILLVICMFFGLFFIFYKYKTNLHNVTFYPLLGLLFFLIGHHHAQTHSVPSTDSNHIFNQIKKQQTVSLYGILAELPSVITLPSGFKTRLRMKVKALHQNSSSIHTVVEYTKASGLILLTLKGLLPSELKPGDHFLAKTKISPVNTFSTPGSFNYKRYLASQSILLKGWVDSPNNVMKVHIDESPAHIPSISVLYFPERIRYHIATFLDKTLTQPSRGLYKAILIGDRSDIAPSCAR